MKQEKGQFFSDVFEVVKLIPTGKVTSYGAIARYLGKKNNARMVGWALNGASTEKQLPAHRVVNSQGILTGKAYFGENNEMISKLQLEGIKITKNKIENFKAVFWDPSSELI